jgi:putative addiction module killer protein
MATVRKTPEFDKALRNIRDAQAKQKILIRIDRLELGNPGDHRNLTGGISELRIDHGPGYRVYYAVRGTDFILLLLCGDKSTQDKDIARANKLNLAE